MRALSFLRAAQILHALRSTEAAASHARTDNTTSNLRHRNRLRSESRSRIKRMPNIHTQSARANDIIGFSTAEIYIRLVNIIDRIMLCILELSSTSFRLSLSLSLSIPTS